MSDFNTLHSGAAPVSGVPNRDTITVTVPKARELSGLGNTKLYELIRSGELKSTTVGTRRLVFVDSLRALLEKGAR